MTTTHYVPASAQNRTPLGRRAASFGLALAIEILLLLAFFTLNSLNPDFFDHAFAFADGFGTTEFGWEDIEFGGDADFDDMVFTVRGVTPIP